MKNKSLLVLIEIIIMLFVFVFCAAISFGVLAKSNETSQMSLARDHALVLAENAAELLKSSAGDIESASYATAGRAEKYGLALEIVEKDSEYKYLGSAEINVYYKGESILSMTASWQEVDANE